MNSSPKIWFPHPHFIPNLYFLQICTVVNLCRGSDVRVSKPCQKGLVWWTVALNVSSDSVHCRFSSGESLKVWDAPQIVLWFLSLRLTSWDFKRLSDSEHESVFAGKHTLILLKSIQTWRLDPSSISCTKHPVALTTHSQDESYCFNSLQPKLL